jgi:hypothetical protein
MPSRLSRTYPVTAPHHRPAGHGSNQFKKFSQNPHGASESSSSFARFRDVDIRRRDFEKVKPTA